MAGEVDHQTLQMAEGTKKFARCNSLVGGTACADRALR